MNSHDIYILDAILKSEMTMVVIHYRWVDEATKHTHNWTTCLDFGTLGFVLCTKVSISLWVRPWHWKDPIGLQSNKLNLTPRKSSHKCYYHRWQAYLTQINSMLERVSRVTFHLVEPLQNLISHLQNLTIPHQKCRTCLSSTDKSHIEMHE